MDVCAVIAAALGIRFSDIFRPCDTHCRAIEVIVLEMYMTQLPQLQEHKPIRTVNRIKGNREGLKWMLSKSKKMDLLLEKWFCFSGELFFS